MTGDDVQVWLDRYIEAWRSYDEARIGDLFSEDAEYRFFPYQEPVRGRAEIVRSWVAPNADESQRDEPGSWEAHYEPWAIGGDRAVAVGTSRYFASAGQPEKLYHNAYLMEFDGEGRCRRFTEFFILDPGRQA
jgi:ketosteroid isomerase-like protein